MTRLFIVADEQALGWQLCKLIRDNTRIKDVYLYSSVDEAERVMASANPVVLLDEKWALRINKWRERQTRDRKLIPIVVLRTEPDATDLPRSYRGFTNFFGPVQVNALFPAEEDKGGDEEAKRAAMLELIDFINKANRSSRV